MKAVIKHNKYRKHNNNNITQQQPQYAPISISQLIFWVFICLFFTILFSQYYNGGSYATVTTRAAENQDGSRSWWDRFFAWCNSLMSTSNTTTSVATQSTVLPVGTPVAVGGSAGGTTTGPTSSPSTTTAPDPSWSSFFRGFFNWRKPVKPTSSATSRVPWLNCLPGDKKDTPAPRDKYQVWSQKVCMWVDQASQNSNVRDDAWMYTDRPFNPANAQKMIDDKNAALNAEYQ